MSVQAISWVLENSEAHLGERLVLLAVANHARADGTGAWPSVKQIAIEAHVSERHVQKCLRVLEDAGELATEHRGGPHGTNLYHLPKMPPGKLTPGKSGTKGVANRAKTHDENATRTVKNLTVPNRPSKNGGQASDPNPNQPTHDQKYLAEKLAASWGDKSLTLPAVVRFNQRYGRTLVEDKMRELRGFDPADAVRNVYAYVEKMCQNQEANA